MQTAKKIKMSVFAFLIAIGSSSFVMAQNKHFPTQGVIEFEKRVNMYALIRQTVKNSPSATWLAQMFEQYQKTNPQFKSLKSSLTFGTQSTLYTPEEPLFNSNRNDWFSDDPMVQQLNTVFSDLQNRTQVTLKKVYETNYLVKDSARNITWKITDEFRNIAGYDCRRANALIMDSVYVVAFYCDQIPVSGGPESFSGLPGMILGVALPYEHVTWFATKVNLLATDDKLKTPSKGKPTDNKGLATVLKEAMKDWGNDKNRILKALTL